MNTLQKKKKIKKLGQHGVSFASQDRVALNWKDQVIGDLEVSQPEAKEPTPNHSQAVLAPGKQGQVQSPAPN